MLAPRQIFRLIRWPLCLCASVLFGCAPIGARTLSTYEPVVVTPLDSVATTVPPGPMSPVPRGATCAKPEA
ncbi:MAG TPA: hypothetical protein VGE52_13150, partial [Pirellulales bacterium]